MNGDLKKPTIYSLQQIDDLSMKEKQRSPVSILTEQQ